MFLETSETESHVSDSRRVESVGRKRVRTAACDGGLWFGRQLMEWPEAPEGLEAL